ncbi:MAG: hypothetical protein ACT4QC_18005 [Planctomycetaceae bacterium]
MIERHNKPTVPFGIAVAVALAPVFYVLCIGPVYRLAQAGLIDHETALRTYAPIGALIVWLPNSQLLTGALVSYLGVWGMPPG